VNAINFDAHSDFRILEGRHSGNGFSYAYEEGFQKYFILDYMKTIPQSVLDLIKKTMIVYVTIHTTASVSERKKSLARDGRCP
jgi:arginase family enzyme